MSANTITITIDGHTCTGEKGQTILQIARNNQARLPATSKIPTLCHDDRVKSYGACGLCVVEAANSPRLLRACATEAVDNMAIITHSETLHNSRKVALELLLSDHRGDCKAPCTTACPGDLDCQGYVGLIANGETKEALKLIKEKMPLPASIGRVCPHPCETACRRRLVEEPISICRLKAYAADQDYAGESPYQPPTAPEIGKKVAIIGGGPGGLTAAYFLRLQGVSVTVYDKMEKMGGMLRYGIPEYRLPKAVLDKEIDAIARLGVQMVTNTALGKDMQLSQLQQENDAVLLAVGAWKSTALGCKGEDAAFVLGGIDFLRRAAQKDELLQSMLQGKKVAVVGGGNTAMDTCRTAVRLGAQEVYNIYRRTKEEMPAEKIEIHEAEEEGVLFKFLCNPVEIQANGCIVLQKMALGEPDQSGRRSPVPLAGDFDVLPVDFVIMSIGQGLDDFGLAGVSLTKRKTIQADEDNFTTNLPGVFAIGDATNKGAGIAIEAIGDGRRAADCMLRSLTGQPFVTESPFYVTQELTAADFTEQPKLARQEPPVLPPEIRRNNFNEVATGFDLDTAVQEASRCLSCGCSDYFTCKLIAAANAYTVKPQRFAGAVHKREPSSAHPYINIVPDKCILCGLCVRVCDEVVGCAALGLVDRGFETAVKPSFNRPLAETECISCGQCVHLCPTGALTEKLRIQKPVPVAEDTLETVCPFCALGCQMVLHVKGETLLRCTPYGDTGLLCATGRFGFWDIPKSAVLPQARIDKKEADWQEACTAAASRLTPIMEKHGTDSVVVIVSDCYTCEEMALLKSITGTLYTWNNVNESHASEEAAKMIRHGGNIFAAADKLPLPTVNSRGLMDIGAIPIDNERLKAARALLIFGGGDDCTLDTSSFDFVLAQNAGAAITAGATIVLPPAQLFHTTGTLTNIHGERQALRALTGQVQQDRTDMLQALLIALGRYEMNRTCYGHDPELSLVSYLSVDALACYRNWLDPETQSAFNHVPTATYEAYAAREMKQRFFASIRLNQTGEIIGSIGLSPETGPPDLAIWLFKPYRGKGYGPKAFALAIRYCFEQLGLEQIFAGCYAHNPASLKMLSRCGFIPHPEGDVAEKHFQSGEPLVQHDYVLIKAQRATHENIDS